MGEAEWDIIALSLRVAALSTLAGLLPALGIAWLLARWNSRWRGLLHGVVMLPLVLPPVVTGYLLLHLLGRSGPLGELWHTLTGGQIAYTTAACAIAAGIVGFPLLVESIRLALLSIDVRYERVSASLGRGRISTWLRVTLPLALPGIASGCIFAFARALGEYGATVVLAGNIPGETQTISLRVMDAMHSIRPEEADAAARLVVASVLIALAALLLGTWLQRAQRKRLAGGEGRGV